MGDLWSFSFQLLLFQLSIVTDNFEYHESSSLFLPDVLVRDKWEYQPTFVWYWPTIPFIISVTRRDHTTLWPGCQGTRVDSLCCAKFMVVCWQCRVLAAWRSRHDTPSSGHLAGRSQPRLDPSFLPGGGSSTPGHSTLHSQSAHHLGASKILHHLAHLSVWTNKYYPRWTC